MLFLQQRDKNRAELLEFLNSTYWRKQGSELHSQNSSGRVKGQDPPHVTSHQKYSGKGPCSIAVLCVTSEKGHRSIGLLGALLHCMGGGMTIVVLWTVSLPHTTQHNTVLVCLTCQGTKHASYRLGLSPKVICNRSCLKIKTFVSLFYCFRE